MFSVILLYAISAITFLISKSLLVFCSPLLLTGLRTFFAGLLMFIYIKYKKQKLELKNCIISLIGIAFFSFYLSNTFKFWSLKYVTASHASILYLAEPLFAAIFSYFLLTEKINLKQFVYLLLCIIGSFISLENLVFNNLFNLYNFVLICSVACSALGAILLRSILLKNKLSIVVANSTTMLLGSVLALSSTFIFEGSPTNLSVNNLGSFLPLLGLMVLISNIFAYNLYGFVLKNYSAVFISCAGFLRPVFVGCYNSILFNEPLNWMLMFSGLIILLGLFLFYTEENNIKLTLPRFNIRFR